MKKLADDLYHRNRAAIGYMILAIGMSVGLYFSYGASREAKQATNITANERALRSQELNKYLAKQCARDFDKDKVFISILGRSIQAARSRYDVDPAIRRAFIKRTSDDIERIKAVDVRCVADIPPPIPSH